MNSLEEAVSRLRKEGVKTGVTKCLDLDLCSLTSVRQFAKEFTALGLPLHVLVNNGRSKGITLLCFTNTLDFGVSLCSLHLHMQDNI